MGLISSGKRQGGDGGVITRYTDSMESSPPYPLAESLLVYVEEAQRSQIHDLAQLDKVLAQAIAESQQAWPQLKVEAEAYVAYVAERVPDDQELGEALERMRLNDLYLACACAAGESLAIGILQKTFAPQLGAAVNRFRASELEDEALQRLWEKLFVQSEAQPARIQQYSGQGPLGGWLSVAAAREVLMLLRKKKPEAAHDDAVLSQALAHAGDQELAHFKVHYRKEFKASFQASLGQLTAKQRNMLRYHYVEGLKFDDIGVIYSVNRSTVCRWLAQCREDLLANTRQHLMTRLRIDSRECDSMVRLVASQLDISIHQHLSPSKEQG